MKATNQVYKNIGMDNDKFIEVSEDIKDLNMAKEEMYEGINNLVNEGDDADIEDELKKLEAENQNENIEFLVLLKCL